MSRLMAGRELRTAAHDLKPGVIIVLTASQDVRDVNKAYLLGANSFLVKPVDFNQFVDLSIALHGYWLWLSKTPETSRPGELPIPTTRPS